MIFISYLFIFTVLYLDIFRQMYYNFSDNILWILLFWYWDVIDLITYSTLLQDIWQKAYMCEL